MRYQTDRWPNSGGIYTSHIYEKEVLELDEAVQEAISISKASPQMPRSPTHHKAIGIKKCGEQVSRTLAW